MGNDRGGGEAPFGKIRGGGFLDKSNGVGFEE